jgi:formiminotetrahydrofolate cyclodeaminase
LAEGWSEGRSEWKDKLPDLEQFLASVASANPIPGGGSSAALAGAIAAGLVGMVCRVTMKKRSVSAAIEMNDVTRRTDVLRAELMKLITLDGDSYRDVVQAYKGKQPHAIQVALKYATDTPLRTAANCGEILTLAASVAPKARESALSDLCVGALVAKAALRGAVITAETNLRDIRDTEYVGAQRARIAQMLCDAEIKLKQVLGTID